MSFLSTGEACARLRERYPGCGLTPRDVSGVIYESRVLQGVPLVGGRRLIPEEMLDVLAAELRRAHKLPALLIKAGGRTCRE